MPYDEGLADSWASISQKRASIGRPIECGDCWIAATALRHGLPLITHNPRDYADIAGLTVITRVS
ncbi:Ribonuclease VapC4 [Phycisphaerales bacterium]|nr:Ribonuclease VapC4 [Phycisphaerales bacterium]